MTLPQRPQTNLADYPFPCEKNLTKITEKNTMWRDEFI